MFYESVLYMEYVFTTNLVRTTLVILGYEIIRKVYGILSNSSDIMALVEDLLPESYDTKTMCQKSRC